MIQWMLAIWSLVPLPFLNPAWTSGSSQFMYCWNLAWKKKRNLAWRILSITLLACECNCAVVWTFFGIAFLWDWNENWRFPVLWPLLQSCQTLCDPMDSSLPGSSVHSGILKARILEWVAMPSSRGSSLPRDWFHVSSVSCFSQVGPVPLAPPGKPQKLLSGL